MLVEQVGGEAAASGKIFAGQQVLSINGEDVSTTPYYSALAKLKSAARPVTFVLRRASLSLVSIPTAAEAAGAGSVTEAEAAAEKMQAILRGRAARKSVTARKKTVDLSVPGALSGLGAIVPKNKRPGTGADGVDDDGVHRVLHASRPGLKTRRAIGDNCFDVVVNSGPLGVLLTGNPNGPDLACAVENVPATSQCKGRVRVGDLLVRVGNFDCTDKTFKQTLRLLKDSSRPIKLGFVAPLPLPIPSSTDAQAGAFTVYTMQDPTDALPARMMITAGAHGVQLSAPAAASPADCTVAFFPWGAISMCKGQMQTSNPDDMELLMLVVGSLGMFIFECNSASLICGMFEAMRAKNATAVMPIATMAVAHEMSSPTRRQKVGKSRLSFRGEEGQAPEGAMRQRTRADSEESRARARSASAARQNARKKTGQTHL